MKRLTGHKKACLAARSFEGHDFGEFGKIYAPFTKLSTLKILLTISDSYDLILEQIDVKNPFCIVNSESRFLWNSQKG